MKLLWIPFLLALMMSGCFEEQYGNFVMTSSAENVPEQFQCIRNYFPIKFNDFDADSPFDGYYRIRLLESIYQTMETNFLTISFVSDDPETLAKCPVPEAGQSYQVTRSGCVRASLQLNGYEPPTMLDELADSKKKVKASEKKCEEAYSVQITGTLEITDFSIKKDKRVTGRLTGEMAYYQRIATIEETVVETPVPLGNVEVGFSFVNNVGAAWDN